VQHLDLEAVVWLEAYLSTYNHILVITSHSADFMDSVCTNIVRLTWGASPYHDAHTAQMDLTTEKQLLYVRCPYHQPDPR
jgi:ATPase subunit of ABC transporter with duplicated ATPase domains